MAKMLEDRKTIEKLAIIAALKAEPEDNIAEITKKVIADYFWALRTIKDYNKVLASPKVELKLLKGKKQKKRNAAAAETGLVAKGV